LIAFATILHEHSHTYHILHFDGHGSYGPGVATGLRADMSRRLEGQLVFEDKDGKPAPISVVALSDMLREHAVPIVVLNACRSAMIDPRALDPFASVAAALLRSGIRSVVAMSYSLYVRAAQQFLPSFYEALFRTGSVSEAARNGRIELCTHPQRSAIAPEVKLHDWLVPVVYQQQKFGLSFAASSRQPSSSGEKPRASDLPAEVQLKTRYAFTGRDGALLELERAMQRKSAGMLIHGLGGVGKTTLAQAFVHWLRVTGGLGNGCFWFTFHDIHTATHVFNEMGRSIFGPQFGLGSLDSSIDQLVEVFRKKLFVIVWDNFESVRGVPETGTAPMLSPGDQAGLRQFVEKLRGAPTKILITSRAREEWAAAAGLLSPTARWSAPRRSVGLCSANPRRPMS
jgi:hypothetical protein